MNAHVQIYSFANIHPQVFFVDDISWVCGRKKDKLLKFPIAIWGKTWMDLENILLSKLNQMEKDKNDKQQTKTHRYKQ